MSKTTFNFRKFFKKNFFNRKVSPDKLASPFFHTWNETYFSEPKKGLLVVDFLPGEDFFDDIIPIGTTRTWLDLITNFLGMPFFSFAGRHEKKQAFLADFLGWDTDKFLLGINILRALFFLPLNLILIIPRLVLNLLKLVTEFIPSLLRNLTNHWINHLINLVKPSSRTHWFLKIFIAVPLIVLFPLHFIFKLVHLIGRAATSPHKSLYAAWTAGEDLAGDGVLGKIISAFFCLISLAITVMAYLIVFPIAIKLAVTYLPSAIVSGIQSVLHFFSPLSKLGAPLSVITNPIFQAMGTFFVKAGSSVVLGIAVVVGVAAGPLVVLLDKALNKLDEGLAIFSASYRKPAQKVEKQPVVKGAKVDKQQQQREQQRQQQQPPKQIKPTKERISASNSIPTADLTFGQELGKGGWGKVFKGVYRHKNKDHVVAIKQPLSKVPLDNKDFQREVAVMSKLKSPHIVRFYGICREKVAIVMEFMSKGNLYDALRKNAGFTKEILYKFGLSIAKGMAYLHGNNIIHADLKTLNVLLDEDLNAKITDFGLSKVKESTAYSSATLVAPDQELRGTIRWMAPELFEATGKTTKATDVFSYGVTVWEIWAKKVPFEKKLNNAQIPMAISRGDRESIPIGTPSSVERAISTCWRQRPEDRPTIDVVVERLENESQKEFGYRL